MNDERECPVCRGTGWMVQAGARNLDSARPCPQCRTRGRVRSLLQAARIPPRYFDRGFEVFSEHHPTQTRALELSLQFVESYPDVRRGLLFVGPCGVGKTHLSVAILRALIQEHLLRAFFVDEAELLRRLQYTYGPDSPDTERDVLNPLMQADLLVWDDLGTGRPTEWVRETVHMVLNHRYTYNKLTILSTNRAAGTGGLDRKDAGLAERIGQRLFSRVLEMCEVIPLEGPDFRTEIRKASLDYGGRTGRTASKSDGPLKVPRGMFRCPACDAKRINILKTETKEEMQEPFVETTATCGRCSASFVVRFFPRTAKLEYLSLERKE